MNKPANNVDLVTQFMEWGSPLNQVFVIDAITKLAESILQNKEDVLKKMEDGFVSGPAWIKCAEEFKRMADQFYNR